MTQVGSNEDVLRDRGPDTIVIDLAGKMVLPGLIDSHTHPTDACMTEFDHPMPPDGDDRGSARLHPCSGRSPGTGALGRRSPGLHHPAQRAALPDSRSN